MNIGNRFTNIVIYIVIAILFVGCSTESANPVESDASKETQQSQLIELYEVDYLKISPMIEENVDKEVIDAALQVIKAFLNYENKANITVHGNQSRFLNDMGYVIDCTCPLFTALTDYNEMTSYDSENNTIVWEFFVSEDEFKNKVETFSNIVNEYLSVIDCADSDAMKAILLYYNLIRDASYDYEILGDAYETMDKAQYHLRSSAYNVFVNKKGICTNLSQGLMFLYTQADLTSGTVLHQGGVGSHMWSIVKIDNQYYYCDPTWDVGGSLKTFGITANDRSGWAGEYTKEEGTMLGVLVAEKYKIDDERFVVLREKIPVEITNVTSNKKEQTITFEGYDYEYTFSCTK